MTKLLFGFLLIINTCIGSELEVKNSLDFLYKKQSQDGSWGDYNKDLTTVITLSTLVSNKEQSKEKAVSVEKGIAFLEKAFGFRRSPYLFGYGDAIMLEGLFEITKYHKSKVFEEYKDKLITRILTAIDDEGKMSEGFKSHVESSLPITYYCLKSILISKPQKLFSKEDSIKIKKAFDYLNKYKFAEGVYKFSKSKKTAYPVFPGQAIDSMIFELNCFYNVTDFDEFLKFFHEPEGYYSAGPIALNRYVNSLLWRRKPDVDFAKKAFFSKILKTQKKDGSWDSFGSMELFEKFDKNLITTCYMLQSLNSLNRYDFKWYDHKYSKN